MVLQLQPPANAITVRDYIFFPFQLPVYTWLSVLVMALQSLVLATTVSDQVIIHFY